MPTQSPFTGTEFTFRCIECKTIAAGGAVGWLACIGGGFDGEPLEVGVFCPECAEREFGNDSRGASSPRGPAGNLGGARRRDSHQGRPPVASA